jgi:Mg-chelatase subunit ChlD
MVDPETGEHQGETDIDQQESGDQEADQSDVNTPEDGQDTDQQEGSGEGPGQSDLTDQEDGSDPRDGEADDQPGGDETAESADGEPGESGEGPAGGQPEADAEAEAERGSNRPDPFDEGDETEYDDERHGVRQFTREDLARERDDMLSLSKSEDIAGSYDIDGPVSEVEDRVTRRYQKIKLAKNSTDESMYVRQTARDERVETDVAAVPASEIRTEVMEGELKNSIEDAFRQLKTRNRYVEQQVGEDLNMDGVITNRSMGSEVRANYKHMQRAEKGDRAVGVALDMSGSMHEMRAKTAIGALYAATEVIGDSFVASGFFSHGGRYDADINTPLITGPDEEFDWDHLNGITTGNGTPTASGVLDGMQLLQAASRPEKVLVVVTDGKPNVAPNGAGNTNQATDSAASAVRRARAEGIKIIGLGVGSVDEGNMATMFGKQDYLMADMDTLADTLLQIYRRQMKIVRDGTV